MFHYARVDSLRIAVKMEGDSEDNRRKGETEMLLLCKSDFTRCAAV